MNSFQYPVFCQNCPILLSEPRLLVLISRAENRTLKMYNLLDYGPSEIHKNTDAAQAEFEFGMSELDTSSKTTSCFWKACKKEALPESDPEYLKSKRHWNYSTTGIVVTSWKFVEIVKCGGSFIQASQKKWFASARLGHRQICQHDNEPKHANQHRNGFRTQSLVCCGHLSAYISNIQTIWKDCKRG